MRGLTFLPTLLVAVACGGSAKHDSPGQSPSGGTAAGVSTGGSETAGHDSGASAGEGASGGTGATADAGAGAGAGGQAVCVELSCLGGLAFIYLPNRQWQPGSSAAGELSEADYTPFEGPPVAVQFSADAGQVELTPVAGGDTVHGQQEGLDAERASFSLDLFAGGRFVVSATASKGDAALAAEYTQYGSGAPVVASTRGTLEQSP